MNIGDSPIVKIIASFFNQIVKFFDTAYQEGWLLYLIVGLIALVVIIVMFN